MKDALKPSRDQVAERIAPFLDREALNLAGLTVETLAQQITTSLVSTLSRDFVVTPRRPLLALINSRTSPEGQADRVAVLEIALAAARMR